jgi:hypothetical protein
MGIEPTSPGQSPSVLSRLNYGTSREAMQPLQYSTGAVLRRAYSELCRPANIDGQVVPQDRVSIAGFEPAPDFRPSALSWRAASPLRGG